MSVIQVGLVDTTRKLDAELVGTVAAALNIQVTRDLPQFWNIQATVQYLPTVARIPAGVWPVLLVSHLPPGEGGFHLDKHHQPFAKVIADPDSDGWTIAASHEVLEMLVDPYGNRMHSSAAIEIVDGKIEDTTGTFGYLVEACDPCEADNYGYAIQGVAVSDFITPHFYDPIATSGTRYSFTGAIPSPRQVLPGGYLSWVDPETDGWQQLRYLDPDRPPTIVDLGEATGGSLREWVDAETAKSGLMTTAAISRHPSNEALLRRSKENRTRMEHAAKARAALYK